jgi:hypothetical protein
LMTDSWLFSRLKYAEFRLQTMIVTYTFLAYIAITSIFNRHILTSYTAHSSGKIMAVSQYGQKIPFFLEKNLGLFAQL